MQCWIITTLVAGTLALTGCATYYVHPTKGPRDFAYDSVRCEAMASTAGGIYDTYGIVRQRVYRQCLYGEGWTQQQ